MRQKSALILSSGIVLAAILFGLFFYSARRSEPTIRVVGYATQDFDADLIKWRFSFSEIVSLDGLTQGYSAMRRKLETFQTIWKTKNIEAEELNIQPVSVQKQYGDYGRIIGYILEQPVYVVSKQLDEVEGLAVNPVDFIQKGLAFEYSNIEFFSSTLPDIKKQLLGEATRNARERAEEIVGATDGAIRKLRSASAGVFQITEPLSTEVSDYGVYNTSTRKKTIRVTVSATFAIR